MSEIINPNDEFELTEEQEKEINGGLFDPYDISVIFVCTNQKCRRANCARIPRSGTIRSIKCKYCTNQYRFHIGTKTVTDQDGNNARVTRWGD